MSRVVDLLEAKAELSPEKMSLIEVMDYAKQKSVLHGHDCCIVVSFKSNSAPEDSYGVSVHNLNDKQCFETMLDLSHLFYEMK